MPDGAHADDKRTNRRARPTAALCDRVPSLPGHLTMLHAGEKHGAADETRESFAVGHAGIDVLPRSSQFAPSFLLLHPCP